MHPRSAALWFIRGHLLWRAPSGHNQAAECFQNVIELDPFNAEAHPMLAGYHDGIRDDPETALVYYRKAADLQGPPAD